MALRVALLAIAVLVAAGPCLCAASDIGRGSGVLPAPTPAPALADAEVRVQAAPAVAAPVDEATAAYEEDELADNETVADDPGGRQGRFLHWMSRGGLGGDASRGPHPTVATFSQRASQLGDILRRAAKFLSAFASAQEDDAANNEVDVDEAERKEDEQDDDSPGSALAGMYTDCLLRLSVPCVQRKLLLFLDRLGRMERFRLLGDFLTVVRVEPRSGEARRIVLDEDADVTDLAGMVDRLVDDFFATHVLRFSLPGTLRVGRSPKTTVDIHLERPGGAQDDDNDDDEEDDDHGRALGAHHGGGLVEGRGSISIGGGGNTKKKQKMLKKIKKKLMKLLMMAMSVMMVMGPMTGGMAGNTAGLALMLGTLALIILKAMLIKQMGGSVGQLFGNIGNSFGNLAGIPGLPGQQGQGTNYLPTGTGGGPYARSDLAYQPYAPYATWSGRASDSWFGDLPDPMTLAYRAYAIATHLK
ncbi:Envelope glycoprotein E [Frankliniella fusca]|uniref:Envelope glycoprotein E n=1 Tax=Frankliniella fusca TaxID=407009 RepID=A0AAE1HH92_9NEOP|nr:Envelope glycoprotein E [Frankliniella fusca]